MRWGDDPRGFAHVKKGTTIPRQRKPLETSVDGFLAILTTEALNNCQKLSHSYVMIDRQFIQNKE